MPRILPATLLLATGTALLAYPAHGSPVDPTTSRISLPSIFRRAASPPQALPERATSNDIRYQPVLDFDNDGCYNVPAIGPDGTLAQGLEHKWVGYATSCRDLSDLDNNNVYSRQRCNSGWCVYLYDYYFEKDVAIPYFYDTGHTHDWEHVAVWVRTETGKAEYVAASQHGNYEIKAARDVRWDDGGGDRPKIVYHKDGGSTHAFRFANAADDGKLENHKRVWFRGPLVGFNGFPEVVLREKMMGHNWGSANSALKNSSFPSQISKAKPAGVGVFDVDLDDGSPGVP